MPTSSAITEPPATILSDHPYALVDGAWVQVDERAAAARFRDYLLGREAQQLALRYGFRPSDPGVSIADASPDNPFGKYAAYGASAAIGAQAETPPADVLNGLLGLWQSKFKR